MILRLLLGLFLLTATTVPAQADTPWTLVKSYPHDPKAFTQGLFFADGELYETTGQVGESEVRHVRLKDGKVLRRVAVDAPYFGEGAVAWGDEIISLTWRHRTGFRWNRDDFSLIATFRYEGEGWGLTHDGQYLIMSDGTEQLRFMDPADFSEVRRITVSSNGRRIKNLNELEWVNGEILANIWYSSRIARINPDTGSVIGWIDLAPLAKGLKLADTDAVLNGMAWDRVRQRLYVTGKYWPKLYQIRVDALVHPKTDHSAGQ